MPSFLINSFKGCISDYDDKGIKGAFRFAKNIDPRKTKDSLSANQGVTTDLAEGGEMNSPVKAVVNASDGNSYWFLYNGKILKRTSSGVWSLVYTDPDGYITGASEGYNNAGDTFLYWRTSTKLHRKRIIGGSYTNSGWSDVDATVNGQTYPKTNLTSTDFGMMRFVNGNLIGANKDTLFMVGYDDSYTNNALQLIPGNVAKVVLESGTNLKLGTYRLDDQERSAIFLWDGISQNYNDKIQLPFANLNAMIETELGIAQFGDEGNLYFFSDYSTLPITAFPGGGQVAPEGVDSYRGMALFGVYGNGNGKSGIYSYGRKRKNADFGLNLDYQFDCDEINAVRVVGSDILFAYKNGYNYGVKKVNNSAKASKARYESLVLKVPPEYQREAEFMTAKIVLDPLPSGCEVEVWRRVDRIETGGDGNGWYQCNLESGDNAFTTQGGTEAVFLIGDKGKFIEIAVVLTTSGNTSPDIYSIEVYFN